EAEFTVDEVAALMMEDLELPWLELAAAGPVPSPAGRVRDVQRRGPWSNLDRRRTLYRHMRRRAARGDAVPLSFHDDDLRFRVWAPDHRRAAQAAVYLLMDRSGSMSTERRYIAKAFFFWLVTFLRRRYTHVDVVFIAHDTEAYLVPEEQFFAFSSSGGTCSSSAYLAALEHIHRRHPPEGWNNYAFHFTDGENFPGDNEKAVEAARRLLQVTRMVGCGEIVYDSWHQFQAGKEPVVTRRSSLFRAMDELDHPRLIMCTIGSRSDVQRAMRELLSVQGGRGERCRRAGPGVGPCPAPGAWSGFWTPPGTWAWIFSTCALRWCPATCWPRSPPTACPSGPPTGPTARCSSGCASTAAWGCPKYSNWSSTTTPPTPSTWTPTPRRTTCC